VAKTEEQLHTATQDVAIATECVACGCRVSEHLFDVGEFTYVVCPGCGLAHLDPRPEAGELAACFDESYFTGGQVGGYDDYERDEALHRRNARSRIERIERPDGGLRDASRRRLLDVGCAHGYVIDAARDAGWDAEGVEISPVLVQRLRERGIRVTEDIARVALDRPGVFDVVTAYQVLEHVADPSVFLRDALRCLRPGGTLVVEMWDRSSLVARVGGRHWHVVVPPSVAWLHSRGPVELMLARADATVVSYERVPKWVSLGLVASLLDAPLRARPIAQVGRALGRLPAAWRVRYPLHDLVEVVARRSDVLSLTEEEHRG
jgi:SAM-dependent methyltransferase